MSTIRGSIVAVLVLACFGLLAPLRAEVVGTVRSFEGAVMVSTDEGQPFAPARVGQELHRGGVVVVMEDSTATLDLLGRGQTRLADNAALRLQEVAGSGEFSTVTGVRAPVLFLYPVGQSDPVAPGTINVTFGLNHDLDTVRGIDSFRLYAIHEDQEYELEEVADVAAVVESSHLLAEFRARAPLERSEYTWYSLESEVPLEEEGDWTLFVVALRGEEPVRLGQSTLLLVEPSGDGEE